MTDDAVTPVDEHDEITGDEQPPEELEGDDGLLIDNEAVPEEE